MNLRWRSERGISIVETVVAVTLMTAVVAVMGPVLNSSQRAGRVMGNESTSIDELRIAIARMDSELRAACYIEAPAVDESASVLTFWTRSPSAGLHQVTYRTVGDVLEREAGGVAGTVATGLVASGAEFAHRENSTGTRAQIDVELHVRFEDDHSPRTVKTTVAGRNTWTSCT